MQNETKYLVLIYKDVPETDFLCEYNGRIRLKITKVPRSRFFEISRKSLCAILDSCILVFEDISHSIGTREDILKAIFWYRQWSGEQKMLILNADY